MNCVAVLMLQTLPSHLRQRGWTYLHHESRKTFALGAPRYIVVYERPYDPGIDHERLSTVAKGRVRVSSKSRMSLSWIHAYRHAIEHMEYIDGKRKVASSA